MAFGAGVLLSVLPLPGVQFGLQSVGAVTDLPEVEATSPDDLAEIRSDTASSPSGDRVTATDEQVREFTTIGFRFDTPPTGGVYVRVRDERGQFGDWEQLSVTDEGPDTGSAEAARAVAVTTDPVWVGKGTGYELSVAESAAAEAEVVTVHDQVQRTVVDASPLAGAAPPFAVRPRSDWGARAVDGLNVAPKLQMGVIHHSASGNNYTPSQVPGILRGIQAYHMDGRGWADIGYNFAVDKFGGIWEARAGSLTSNIVGAQAIGFNYGTVGVMILGDYSASQAPAVAIEGAGKVFGWKLGLNGTDPMGTARYVTGGGSNLFAANTTAVLPVIVGHKQTSSTSCPGRIMEQLNSIREQAKTWARAAGGKSPTGAVDKVRLDKSYVVAEGWAKDDDTTSPIDVFFVVNGNWYVVPADRPGNRFEVRALAKPGNNQVCAAAINVLGGDNTFLSCTNVVK